MAIRSYFQEHLLPFFVTVKQGFLDILSPCHCCICHKILPTEAINVEICRQCEDRIPPGTSPEILLNTMLRHFSNDELALSALFSQYSLYAANSFDLDFSQLVYAVKYQKKKRFAIGCGKKMGEWLQPFLPVQYDGIIPIPLHTAKVRERGYNQSELLAIGLSKVLHIPMFQRVVQRKRYTSSQTTKTARERVQNVHNVFHVHSTELITTRRILLVDDVVTTGSTLNACATALLEAGATRVDAITLTNA